MKKNEPGRGERLAALALLPLLACLADVAGAHGISEEARRRMLEGGNLEYIRLGAEHMITGYDHLLFLFGVMFFLSRLVDIVKFVSAFTIGHTITLIFATYLGITANYYLIDAFIAVTVIYKAFENLDGFRRYLNSGSPNLLAMVFLFGLVHGFGLSTRLQQLPIADDGGMLLHILSFNLGVEIGQIGALLVMWAILRLWRTRNSFPLFSRVVNAGLMAAGILLLGMQLHGYSHTAHAETFPISRDDHAHAHVEMRALADDDHATPAAAAGAHSHGSGPAHTHDPESAPAVPSHD